jgi:hypothetical protein
MKKLTLLFAICSFTGFLGHAQETVSRTSFIGTSITEKFEVLKSDKKVRQGIYTASFKQNTIAKGAYQNGARTGSWDFFNAKGKLVQTYNYNQNKFTLLDTADLSDLKYFLENVKPADAVTAPIKIGGSCYGIFAIVYRDELSQMVRADNPGVEKVQYTHVITLNTQGNIVSHQVTAVLKGVTKTYTLDDSHLDHEVTRFTPALLNHQPVQCQVTLVTYANYYGAIERNY